MLRVCIDKGNLKMALEGDASEIVTDLLCVIGNVCDRIEDKSGDSYVSDFIAEAIKDNIDLVRHHAKGLKEEQLKAKESEVAKTIKEIEKMQEEIKELKKTLKKGEKDA